MVRSARFPSYWQNRLCSEARETSEHTLTVTLKVLAVKQIGSGYIRDAILVQCVQCSVAVLGGRPLVHVPEALHGRDVPLDALLGEVKL